MPGNEKQVPRKPKKASSKRRQPALGFLYEGLSPRDPNYQRVRQFYRGFLSLLQEIEASIFGGEWSVQNFVDRYFDAVANHLFFVAEYEDNCLDSTKLKRIEQLGTNLASVIEPHLKAVAERLDEDGDAVVKTLQWRILQVVAIAKTHTLRIEAAREHQRRDAQAKAAQVRQEWMNKMGPGWSVFQWSQHTGNAYETLKKYHAGVTTNQTNSIRADLAKFLGVSLSEVPE